MHRLRLHAEFLVFILGSLVFLLSLVSYALIEREAALLRQNDEEKQHVLAFAVYFSLKENVMQGTPYSGFLARHCMIS